MVEKNFELAKLEKEKQELNEIYRQTVIERNQKIEPLDKNLERIQNQIRDVNFKIDELKPKEDRKKEIEEKKCRHK